MSKETYPCKCGGTLSFNHKANWENGAWQCDGCDFETMHVRVDERGKLHENTFDPTYGAGKRAPLAKHKTTHAAHANDDGRVLVFCETCDWRRKVDVTGLSWQEGMTKIFEARDAHEAAPAKPA